MPALHGRLAELKRLDDCLERADAGRSQVVLIEGEPGIGKSRMLEEALRSADARGFHTFLAGADEVERARPFGPLVEALGCTAEAKGRRAEIATLLRGDAAAGQKPIEPTRDPGLQFRVVDAFVDLVEELVLRTPVLLAVEDVHWADSSTLLALRAITRRLTYLPFALFLTARPFPDARPLDRLVEALVRDGAHLLSLGPLEQEAVEEIVTELVAAEPTPSLLEEVAGAAGNPLFISELVKALGEEGAIEVIDGRAELRETSLPPSLRLTILRRLSFLGEEVFEALRVASVLGSAFSLHDLATVVGHPPTELLGPMRGALQTGVLEDRKGKLAFRHDLIRAAIYEDLPEDVRAALHLEAGRRLAAAGAPALRVAEQLALGAQPGDLDAVTRLHAAARQAAATAPAIAAGLLERAIELAAEQDDLRPRLVADLVPVLLWSGRPHDAERQAASTIASSPPPDVEGALRLGLVAALSAQGRHPDVVEQARRAAHQTSLSAELRSQLRAEAANSLAFMGDLDAAEQTAREAVEIGDPGQSDGAAMGLLVLCDVAKARGNLSDALDYATKALNRVPSQAGVRLRWPPEIFLSMTLQHLDRFDEADDGLRRGRQLDERLGNVSYLPVYHYEAASIRFADGRWDDAVAHAQAGLDLADEVGLGMLRTWPHLLLALIAVHRDALEDAADWLADDYVTDDLALPRALLEEARGDTASALASLSRAWDDDSARGIADRRRGHGPDLVRLALAAGKRDQADAVAADVEQAARLGCIPSLEGAALRCRGLIAGDPELLVRGVEAYRKSPRVFERALACEDAAAAVSRIGRHAEAATLFREALNVYEQVGARRPAARALASMRALGIGRKRRGAHKRPETGWESLTPSELEVVRLAAGGLTNPQIGQRLFISRRTVQTHLAHVFRKLNISSRVDLAAEAARRGGI